MKEYGLMIGRFQPVHFGHLEILEHIIDEGMTPIIVIGSTQDDRDVNRNPLTFEQRKQLWMDAFPELDAIFISQEDKPSYEEWAEYIAVKIRRITEAEPENIFIYTGDKDSAEGTYAGVEVANDMDVFHTLKGYSVDKSFFEQEQEHPNIHATTIRHSLEDNKDKVPLGVYKRLVKWGWK